MTYGDALDYLKNMATLGSKHGLEDFRGLLGTMGNPEKSLNIIHTAGTNGKGSFCGYMSAILMAAGYSTGVFTSPHLVRYNERFSLNGAYISDEELAEEISLVKQYAEEYLDEGEWFSFFEIMTAVCFSYFSKKKPDFLILETGLGGRLDATNVALPLMCSIMKIDIDHTEFLGSTLNEIAYEKSGIIKENTPCVLYPDNKEVLEVVKNAALDKNAPLYFPEDVRINIKSSGIDGTVFDIDCEYFAYENLTTHMPGTFQPMNIAAVLTGVSVLRKLGYDIPDRAVYEGTANAKVRGRMDIICKKPLIIADGAHNMNAAREFSEFLKGYDKKTTLITGVLKDKMPEKLIAALSENADRVIMTIPDSKRGFDPRGLVSDKRIFIEKPAEALRAAVGFDDSTIFIAGSLYLTGEILRLAEGEFR